MVWQWFTPDALPDAIESWAWRGIVTSRKLKEEEANFDLVRNEIFRTSTMLNKLSAIFFLWTETLVV